MKHRLLRVNELVKRELSRIVTRDLYFDGLLVTINQVNVTPDLRSGHVFVSVLGQGSAIGVIQKLEANRTVLQAEMAKTVVLKYTPHLVFHLDDSIERGTRVFKILEEITPATDAADDVDPAEDERS
jgi:ribosome-binding factor A